MEMLLYQSLPHHTTQPLNNKFEILGLNSGQKSRYDISFINQFIPFLLWESFLINEEIRSLNLSCLSISVSINTGIIS